MNKYEDMDLDSVVNYINAELLKGRSMKDIEKNDFGVNERVIVKRLARKNIKRVDGQFVLQDGSKMTEDKKNESITVIEHNEHKNEIIKLNENTDFIELKNKVDLLEQKFKLLSTQNGSNMVTNDLGLKICSSDEKPIAKTVRLYKEVWDKIDKVKDKFPHLNYQTVLNSLLDEITNKYLDE